MKTRTGRNIGAPSQNVRRTAKSRVGVNSSQLKKSGRNSARLQKASTKQGNVRGIVAGTLGEKTSRKVIRSYKELHPVGKRRSSQFVTYSQDGRLFYDLYARSSPYSSVAKAVSTTHKSSPDSATPNNPDFVSETSRGSMKKKEKQSANKPVPIVIRSVRQSRAADRNFVSASSATARVSHITRRKASKLQVDPVRKASTRESTNPHGQISKIRASTLKMKPRNSDSPSQRHVRPHKRARRESVSSVERKLRRELGTSTSIVAVGKRMASLNATALITAVTRSPYDRTAVANPCDDRRVSSETIPCLDEYPGDVLDLAADKSDDSKTESMRGTPEHAAGADELDVPSVEKPAKVRPTKRIRRNRSVSQKSNSLQVTPAIVNPTGPALESYHSQHFIPFGDSRFGFQQITHQVVRMGTPDKISGSTTKTLSYSETQLHPLSHSLHQGTVPDVSSIVRPQSTDPNLCHPMIPVVNTGPLTCGSLCFPILTPLSSLGNWPYPQLAVQNFGFNGVPFQSPGFFIPSVAAYSPQLQITTQCPILSPISQQMAYPNNFIRPPVAGANVGTPGAPTFTCIQPHQLGSTCTPFSPLCYPAVSACEMHPSLGQLHPSPMPPRGFLGVSSSGQVSIQYPPTAEPFASQPIQLMAVPNASIPHPQVVPTIPPSPPSLQPPQNQSRTPFSVLSVLPSEHLLTVRNVCDPSALCSKPAASIAVAECTAPVHSEVMPTGITTIPAPDFATESTVQNPCPDSNVPEFGQNTVEGKDFESASNTEDPGAISDDSEGAWEWEGKPYEKLVFVQSDAPPVACTCFHSIRHRRDGMVISEKDNVLLCSGPDRNNQPHVAKITALFPDSTNGTKMMAILWYYRPEHVNSNTDDDLVPNELYVSRHCDTNPVDCIEDKAYVLPVAAYCRFLARVKYRQSTHARSPLSRIVPPLSTAPEDEPEEVQQVDRDSELPYPYPKCVTDVPDTATVSNVFLCRSLYDYKLKRVSHTPPFHGPFPFCNPFITHLFSRNRAASHARPESSMQKCDDSLCGPSPVVPPSVFPLAADSTVTITTPSSPPPQLDEDDSVTSDSPVLRICVPDPGDEGTDVTETSHNYTPAAVPNNNISNNTPTSAASANDLSVRSAAELILSAVISESLPGVPSTISDNKSSESAIGQASTPLKNTSLISEATHFRRLESDMPLLKPFKDITETQQKVTPNVVEKNLDFPSCSAGASLSHPSTLPSVMSSPNSKMIVWPTPVPMSMYEPSVLERSADLSVNWGEHGEQIALSLDCKAREQACSTVYTVPLSEPSTVSAARVSSTPLRCTTTTIASGLNTQNVLEKFTDRERFPTSSSLTHSPPALPPVLHSLSNAKSHHDSDSPRLVIL